MTLCSKEKTSFFKYFVDFEFKPDFTLKIFFAYQEATIPLQDCFMDFEILRSNEGLFYVNQDNLTRVYKVSQNFEYWSKIINKLQCKWMSPKGVDKNKELSDFLEQNKDKMIEIRTINKK